METNRKIGEGESVRYAVTVSKTQPGDKAVVFAHNKAVIVQPDAAPAPGTVASGFLFGRFAMPDVSIQADITHADGTTCVTAFVVDVGEIDRPAPVIDKKPVEPITAKITLGDIPAPVATPAPSPIRLMPSLAPNPPAPFAPAAGPLPPADPSKLTPSAGEAK